MSGSLARGVALIVLSLVTRVAAQPAIKPATGPAAPAKEAARNPEYEKWARLKEGAWVRVRVLSTFRTAEWTTRLVKVTGDDVRLEVTEAKPGEKPGEPREERVAAAVEHSATRPAAPDEAGEGAVAVSGVEIPCHWERRETRGKPVESKAGDKPEESGKVTASETTWACAGIPGFVKRVSRLAADANLNLPETRATELLIAFDLPPRETARAAGPATRPGGGENAAGAAAPLHVEPPSKLSWTYRFDPPGWRRWSRLDEGHWDEQWETGETIHFTIVGWVADGERVGTVVRRADGGLESVLPDAGKGAWIWFHSLPNGEWKRLGQVEESE